MNATEYCWPSQVVLSHPSVFTRFELEAYEEQILANPKATEREASEFFTRFPKFLFLGTGKEIRREVTLLGPDGKPIGRVDFFRHNYGETFWDIIELKDPKKSIISADGTNHPRLASSVNTAISQAEDYRAWLNENADTRANLLAKGIQVNHPQILVVVGQENKEVSEATMKMLLDRVSQNGVTARSYSYIFKFAKDHYMRTKMIVLPALVALINEPEAVVLSEKDYRMWQALKSSRDSAYSKPVTYTTSEYWSSDDDERSRTSDELRDFERKLGLKES